MKKILFCMCAFISLSACGQRGGNSVETADSVEAVDSVDTVDTFDTPDGYTATITPLMHASIRIESGGFEIEVDPVAKLGDRTTDYSAMPEADLILVTHEHFDHFDTATIKRLSPENTITVMNPRCHELSGMGQPLSNGMTLNIAEDVRVEAVPAYNVTEGRQHFHPQGRDNGYILTINGLRIYIAGDTEPIPEMEQIRDIDIAFLPCNQPYTMTVEQLVSAAKIIKPKVLYPYHFGQTDLSALPALLKDSGIDVRIRPFD